MDKLPYIRWKYGPTSLLQRLVQIYQHLRWDYAVLSSNPNISFEFVKSVDKGWMTTHVDESIVTEEDIINNPTFPFRPEFISANLNISWNFIKNNPQIEWDWYTISSRFDITTEIINSNPGYPWDIRGLSQNANINNNSIRFLHHFINEDGLIDFDIISRCNLSSDFIEKYANYLDWLELSRNPNITIDFVNDHPDYPWDNYSLSQNPNITIEKIKSMITEYPPCFLSWPKISSNPKFTITDILENLHLSWDWSELSKRMSWDDICQNFDLPWKWYCVSKNENVTMDIIFSNPDKPWDWKGVSENPNLDEYHIDFVLCKFANTEWLLSSLCRNKFLYNDKVYQKSLQLDIENRQQVLKKLLLENEKFYTDIINIVAEYTSYN